MSRRKLFIENVFAYGLIDVLNKVIPFILLPVITRMIPNASDFGVFNMYGVIMGFGTAFALLGLYDAMFREYFEKEDQQYRYDVTTTAQRIILGSSILISVTLVLFNKQMSALFFGDPIYGNIITYTAIGIFLGANQTSIQGPTRIQNERKVFVVSGLLNSIVAYGISLFLIYKGFSYYGLIYSNILTSLAMIVFFWIRNKDFFIKGSFNKKIAKELFKIGLPLLPTFLIYWLYNSMDKIIITNMLGLNDLGIYSIGSKLAQISQLIYAGFAGGYSYFKYKTMNDSDQVQMNSKLFEYLGVISICAFTMIYPFVRIVFKVLFDGPYEQGYIVASYLFLSPLLLMLFQVVGTQFIVVKKSYFTSITLAFGAISNVILNFVLIPYLGIEGSAIATLSGYSISVIAVCIFAKKYNLLILNKKTIRLSILTIIYILINRCLFNSEFIFNLFFTIIVMSIILFEYRIEVKSVLSKYYNKE